MPTIDLHGKAWSEALTDFLDFYNRNVATGDSLGVVHGYGSSGAGGAMRTRLRAFLAKHPESLAFTPGEQLDGNPGYTVVRPVRPLPGFVDLLAEQVWEYCENPRTNSKITGRFRRHGDPQVQQAIRTLEKQGRLKVVSRGRLKEYRAA